MVSPLEIVLFSIKHRVIENPIDYNGIFNLKYLS